MLSGTQSRMEHIGVDQTEMAYLFKDAAKPGFTGVTKSQLDHLYRARHNNGAAAAGIFSKVGRCRVVLRGRWFAWLHSRTA